MGLLPGLVGLALALAAAPAMAKQLQGLERCEGGEFFESGPLKDSELSLGRGDGGRSVRLSSPIRIGSRDFYEAFLSPKGVIGLGRDFHAGTQKGWSLPWEKAWVAPFWSDQIHYRHGSIFYRETTSRLYLDRADRQLDYQGFKYRGSQRIRTRSIFIVTFLDLKEDPWRQEEGHSFQVSFYSTNAGSFVNFIFGNIDERGLVDQEGGVSAGDRSQLYQFPFDARRQPRLLTLLGNTSTKGNWLIRVDGRSGGTRACTPHSRRVDICSERHSFTHDSYCEPRRLPALSPMRASECRRECQALLGCPAAPVQTNWVPRWKRARNVSRREPRPESRWGMPRRSSSSTSRRRSGSSRRRSDWRSRWGGGWSG